MNRWHKADAVGFVVESMKILRSQTLPLEDIVLQLECHPKTAKEWMPELVAQGIIVEVERPRPRERMGGWPKFYTLAREWGGQ